MLRKLFFLILVNLSGISTFSQVSKDNIQDIMAAGNSGLSNYLEKIPPGRESLYGFKNRDEFKIAILGKPYQMATLNNDFFSDSRLLPDKNYFVSTGEYRVPIIVNGEHRALLTVGMMHGVWKTVGIGAAGMAKELDEFENKYTSSNQSGMILRVYQLECDFVLLKDISNSISKAYPLVSAKMTLDKTNDTISAYLISQLLPLIKQINSNNK